MHKLSVTLRLATPGDAAKLARFAEMTFRESYASQNTVADMNAYVDATFQPEGIARELDDPSNTFIIAQTPDQVVGYAKLRRGKSVSCVSADPAAELERIYVHPDLAGKGVGKRLLARSLDIVRAEAAACLWLGVWEHNQRAIEFYISQGFVDVGSHYFRLGSQLQGDRIMQLELR